jgi:hypothetical protein
MSLCMGSGWWGGFGGGCRDGGGGIHILQHDQCVYFTMPGSLSVPPMGVERVDIVRSNGGMALST